jgi:putative SOS response-associated peptidase YedK
MPVILDPQTGGAWLDPENRPFRDLLKQFPSGAMEAWQDRSVVGNVRNDVPELIEPV